MIQKIVLAILLVTSSCFGRIILNQDGDNIVKVGQTFSIFMICNPSCCNLWELKELPQDSCIHCCGAEYEKMPWALSSDASASAYIVHKFKATAAGKEVIILEHNVNGFKIGEEKFVVTIED